LIKGDKMEYVGELKYLNNKPKFIHWKVVAGPELSFYEMYDVIFDEKDLRIRRLKWN
jgi:hypothetical protein